MNDDDRIRRLLEEHWEVHANSADFEEAHAIYHDDVILEWPQRDRWSLAGEHSPTPNLGGNAE